MKRLLIPALVFIGLFATWSAAPVSASGHTYTQTFDNSGSYSEITLIQGTHNGFGYLNGVRAASSSDWIEFTIDFGEEKYIQSFSFDVYHASSNSNHISFVWYQYDGTEAQVGLYAQYTQVVAPNTWHTRNALFDSTAPTRYYKFLLWHTRSTPGALHIDNLSAVFFEEDPPELGRPLRAADELAPYFEDSVTDSMISLSSTLNAYVYSVQAGTVTLVERLYLVDCGRRIRSTDINPGACMFEYDSNAYFAAAQRLALSQSFLLSVPPIYSATEAWRVQVTTTTGDIFEYLVNDAHRYISEGDSVEAGCYLGKVMRVRVAAHLSAVAEFGITVVTKLVDGQPESIVDESVVYPSRFTPCRVNDDFRECQGDGALESLAQWSTNGAVSETRPGFILGPGASVSQQMNLNPDYLPRMRIAARSISGSAQVLMKLGETEQTITAGVLIGDYEIAADEHQPDIGLFYTVKVTNQSNQLVQLDFICVSFMITEDDEEREDDPPNCYFVNSSFSDNTGWNTGGTVFSFPGEFRMVSDAIIYQNVRLHPGDYVISVTAALWHYNTYEPEQDDTTGTITLEYDWPQDSTYATIEAITVATLAAYDNVYTFSAQFTVGTTTEGLFVIRPVLASMDMDVQGISIREACLNPVGEGWPENPDGPTGGEPESIVDEDCTPNPRPSGEALSSWISWHWRNLRGFFTCELMVMLNDMYRLGLNTYRLMGWSARWSQSAIIMGADWLSSDALYWLEGHFANMALGRETFIQVNESQSCSNLWCAIGALFGTVDGIFDNLADVIRTVLNEVIGPIVAFLINILNTTIGFIFSLIIALVSVGIYLVSLVIVALNQLLALFAGLIGAWNNATPTPIDGLPTCAINPQENGFCIALWVMENTVFSGRGALFIPLLIGWASINLLLWAIGEIKKTIMQTGSAL